MLKRPNTTYYRHSLLCLLALCLLACASDDDDNSANHSADNTFKMVSYNVGLAPNFVPYTRERVPANEQLMAELEADVVCLQEVWLDEHVQALSSALTSRYPYQLTADPGQIVTSDAACSDADIVDLVACANTQCDSLSGTELVACVTAQCGSLLTALPSTCFNGVVASVGTANITTELLVGIVTQPTGIFSYGGSLGLILASRYPLQNTEFQDFIEDSSSVHRGALYAEVEVNETTVVVGCTHSTADLSGSIEYPQSGKHGSWAGENLYQQDQMISFVKEKAGTRAIFFAGDFNCSIANEQESVIAGFPDSCQRWLDDGFVDPGAAQLGCTFCSNENLILSPQAVAGGGGGEGDLFLDHIYVKNLPSAESIVATRLMDDLVSVDALDPPQELALEDAPISTHPSDHFGMGLEALLF